MKYQFLSMVTILRDADGSDCTNGGISSRYTDATLLVPEDITEGLTEKIALLGGLKDYSNSEIPFPENTFILVKRTIFGTPYFHVEPYWNTEKRHCMAGGNYLSYSGNGFRSITGYPIAIHDRFED